MTAAGTSGVRPWTWLSPRRAATLLVALIGAVALWNAIAYPAGAGYDAHSHWEYADFLIDHHRLPVRGETPEYYSPPLYYVVAGAVTWIGREAGMGEPHKLGQLLNVPILVGVALLTLALARELWPRRPWLGVAAVGFLAVCPVLLRTGSMFNPEPLDLLLSLAALLLAARLLLRREYTWRSAIVLGVVLGLGELVRQFALWTLAVVLIALGLAAVRERALRTRLVAVVAAALVVAGPWYGYRLAHYSNPVFDRPLTVDKPFFERRPASFYVDLAPRDVFSRPYRPHFVNRVVPQTYSDLWGDWYGVFAWGYPAPPARARAWLVWQNAVGLAPTLLALGGWLVLLVATLRRRDAARLLPALLPLAGIAGYLYFTIGYPTPDGDVIKPTYMLTTAGAWALCFGWAVDRIGSRRLALGVAALAVVALPFVVYRGALGLL